MMTVAYCYQCAECYSTLRAILRLMTVTIVTSSLGSYAHLVRWKKMKIMTTMTIKQPT